MYGRAHTPGKEGARAKPPPCVNVPKFLVHVTQRRRIRTASCVGPLARGSFAVRQSMGSATTNAEQQRYVPLRNLGKGSFGEVALVQDNKNSRCVAMKIMKMPEDGQALARVNREIAILEQLDHPHIVTLFEVERNTPGYLYLIMQFLEGGSLESLLELGGALTEPEGRVLARQLLSALRYVHSLDVLHRDIKPDNVMASNPITRATLEQAQWKFCDFGFARRFDRAKHQPRVKRMLTPSKLRSPARNTNGSSSSSKDLASSSAKQPLRSQSSKDLPSSPVLQPLRTPDTSQRSQPPSLRDSTTELSEGSIALTEISVVGTEQFMAPELRDVLGEMARHSAAGTALPLATIKPAASPMLDIFSFGRMLQNALTGIPPDAGYMGAFFVYALPSRLVCRTHKLRSKSRLSADAQGLLAGLLDQEPGARLSAEKAHDHKWVQEGQPLVQGVTFSRK